ncbi:hypothetical protein PRIPAC_85532 [Pristionchus pacificus]|uniref:Phosphatidate cytidylyltransferase, mitochondrial n=1 Tax=Pristionchus pacificus TaxID=54126 RepID=A0A2A6BU36_PRIPA|nr:hypothetical protein PRIPAC_85532 [Pristionchus pacificus]|eukprot:PDM69323.1 hypothetical protein PRIPAC_47625 [Pristionchus pacificus]
MSVSRRLVKELISDLPLGSVNFAFAYGSGVVPQENERMEDKMVDLVLCTKDPQAFHADNLQQNPSHYSFLRMLGPATITKLQQSTAKVFYNTQIRTTSGRLIKYGVISEQDLKTDLLDWRWMYIAGRLQKPVVDVIEPTADIATWIGQNRLSALQASLLLLPTTFTYQQLFEKLVGLSYKGDFRMIIGEDQGKIAKIARGNADRLEEVYAPLLQADERVSVQNGNVLQNAGMFSRYAVVWDASTPAIYHRLNLLPYEVVTRLMINWNREHKTMIDAEEVVVLFALARRHDVADHIERTISTIVRDSSLKQTAKNALSAGVLRSIKYSSEKLIKWGKSIQKAKEETKGE